MAEETTVEKPRRGRPPGRKSSQNGGEKARKSVKYHIYSQQEDGYLKLLASHEGRNAEEAVSNYLAANENEDSEGTTFVIVPDRNMTRVTVAVETTTKVRLRSA